MASSVDLLVLNAFDVLENQFLKTLHLDGE